MGAAPSPRCRGSCGHSRVVRSKTPLRTAVSIDGCALGHRLAAPTRGAILAGLADRRALRLADEGAYRTPARALKPSWGFAHPCVRGQVCRISVGRAIPCRRRLPPTHAAPAGRWPVCPAGNDPAPDAIVAAPLACNAMASPDCPTSKATSPESASSNPTRSATCTRHSALADIVPRLRKPKHPWTNRQVERMNRNIRGRSKAST